jgi:hypothetical protein
MKMKEIKDYQTDGENKNFLTADQIRIKDED